MNALSHERSATLGHELSATSALCNISALRSCIWDTVSSRHPPNSGTWALSSCLFSQRSQTPPAMPICNTPAPVPDCLVSPRSCLAPRPDTASDAPSHTCPTANILSLLGHVSRVSQTLPAMPVFKTTGSAPCLASPRSHPTPLTDTASDGPCHACPTVMSCLSLLTSHSSHRHRFGLKWFEDKELIPHFGRPLYPSPVLAWCDLDLPSRPSGDTLYCDYSHRHF
ncbi:hypothetical protein CALVIDRAFT_40689 [Calocera viscosa TUFC12733]|uniref:Uncharacterized protein n=1 Tax=Calocera viscosa (strain TUFC12733) TaxID=1330018 RepID=A0A167P2A4_CALVF|nr:hypothetical protein CALVIDRAFT_40689 [Calocera viscosa TUFC12733]